MNNMTLYPAHSDAQVANAANAYLHSDLNFPNPNVIDTFDTRTLIESQECDHGNKPQRG